MNIREKVLDRAEGLIGGPLYRNAIVLAKGGVVSLQQEREVRDGFRKLGFNQVEYGVLVAALTDMFFKGNLVTADAEHLDIGFEVLAQVSSKEHALNVDATRALAEGTEIAVVSFNQHVVRELIDAYHAKVATEEGGSTAPPTSFLAKARGRASSFRQKYNGAAERLHAWLDKKAGGQREVEKERKEAHDLQKELEKVFKPSESVEELRQKAVDARKRADTKRMADAMAACEKGLVDEVRRFYIEADQLDSDANHFTAQADEKEAEEKAAFEAEQERFRRANLAADRKPAVVRGDHGNLLTNGIGQEFEKMRKRLPELEAEAARLSLQANTYYDAAQGVIDAAKIVRAMTFLQKGEVSRLIGDGMTAEKNSESCLEDARKIEEVLAADAKTKKEEQKAAAEAVATAPPALAPSIKPKRDRQRPKTTHMVATPTPAATSASVPNGHDHEPPTTSLVEVQKAEIARKILVAIEQGNVALIEHLNKTLELLGGATPSN